MKNVLRAALAAAFVVSVALAGSAHAASPEPDTIGATVQTIVYVSDDRALVVINRGTVAETFTFEPSGGWGVEPASVTLDAGATGRVTVTGEGEDGAKVAVSASAAGDVPQDVMRTAVAFHTTILHEAPFDLAAWIWRVLAAALVVGSAVVVLRRTRPWDLRVTRRVP
jgi:hypothetical protein